MITVLALASVKPVSPQSLNCQLLRGTPQDFVLEPVYPEFLPPEDDVLPAEEQPLPAAVSPTADLPGYIIESNPEEDLKEDDEDLEEDLVDYLTDRDDDDDEEEESYRDDVDDEEEEEDEDE
ncbi:hypothetical protein Tco_0227136 [Tanacetum coccineum]